MATDNTVKPPVDERPPLRLWPGVLLVAIQWLLRFVVPVLSPDAGLVGVLGGLLLGIVVALWWLTFSRASLVEKLAGVVLMAGSVFAVRPFLHESVASIGQGILFFTYAVPAVCLALVLWAALTRSWTGPVRLVSLAVALLLGAGSFLFLRTEGITGTNTSQFAWRWSKSSEERFLAEAADDRLRSVAPAAEGVEAQWPGFRGPYRDSRVPGVALSTDWDAAPPKEVWRQSIGPGWSSFAVRGQLFYTQEQRGEEEVVSAYELGTGEPVWRHADGVRFWEAMAGAGPRATPTVLDDRIFAQGATGLINVLDADSGELVWSRDVSADAEVAIPGWGFAASPLVMAETVYTAAAGRLVAYDRATGDLLWQGETGTGYSSPQLMSFDGSPQLVMLSSTGASGHDPSDGKLLWNNDWSGEPIVQPAQAPNGDLLWGTVSTTGGAGLRRLAIERSGDGWQASERWTTNRLKPYFNDFVLHEGNAYGFDGSIMACIDLEEGKRQWKGGRYGNGQLLLLPDQDLLLVITEEGELKLVEAKPDGFNEVASAPAIEGKTWNHPVLVGDLLLVRNAEEMAAFRLPTGS